MSRALAVLLVCLTTTHALGHRRSPMAPPRAAEARITDQRDKRYPATRTSLAPRIDGHLDDAGWRAAQVETRFTQNFPDEGKRPSQRTELRVLYDDTALYIGVQCWDTSPAGIVERLTRRDRETDADKVTVDISSKNDRITAYHFDVNVSGVLADGVRFNDTDYSGDWDGLWLGATSRNAQGWSAEIMIPLKTLRYEGHRSEFGFQVRRYVQRRQEVDEWAYTPRASRGEVSYYGTLDGLAGLHATRLFQIVPYLASGIYLRYQQDPAVLDGTRLYGNIGADLKVGLTPALTLDATINPDFGQVEADQVVLNLSTFEVFFPEKRPFFLEGVDVFATPLQLFYSRRIGRPAPAPDSNSFTLLEPEAAGRIYAAAKLTGVVARRMTVGLLDAVTAQSTSIVSGIATPTRQLAVTTDPMSNFAVLRLKRDVLSRSYIGAIATATTRFEQPFSEQPKLNDNCPDGGAPSLAGRCTRDAYTGAVDFNLRTNDGDWGALGQVAMTALAGGPTRTTPDGTVLGPGSKGMAVSLDGGKFNGKYNAQLEYRGFSSSYDANDVGFNQQGNLQLLRPHLHYRILKPIGILQEGDINFSAMLRFSWDFTTVLQHEYWLGANLRFRNFWSVYFEVDYDTTHWDLREARDGAAVERSGGWAIFFMAKTDPRRRLWVGANGFVQRVRHGQASELFMQWALRPIPAVEIDIMPHATWTFGDPRWFDTVANADGSNRYYFAQLESRELDVTLRATYTFLPTLTLQAYAQLFIAGGHYDAPSVAVGYGKGSALPLSAFHQAAMPAGDQPDFRDGAININLVLRWEFKPGSTVVGVYTHAQQQTVYDPLEGIGKPQFGRFSGGAGTDLFLLKLSLLLI